MTTPPSTACRMVQGFFWLALGTWLGALVALPIAADATFKTVHEHQDLFVAAASHTERSVNLLAGDIIGGTLDRLRVLQWICAIAVVLCLLLQYGVFAVRRSSITLWAQVALVAVPMAILSIDSAVLSPAMKQHRLVKNDRRRDAEQIAAAAGSFNRLHQWSERLLVIELLSLGGAMMVGGFMARAGGGSAANG